MIAGGIHLILRRPLDALEERAQLFPSRFLAQGCCQTLFRIPPARGHTPIVGCPLHRWPVAFTIFARLDHRVWFRFANSKILVPMNVDFNLPRTRHLSQLLALIFLQLQVLGQAAHKTSFTPCKFYVLSALGDALFCLED